MTFNLTERQKKAHALRQALDDQLVKIKSSSIARPKKGWIKSIREALGMSGQQLAKRLLLDPSTVARLEDNEVNQTITLGSLSKIADALECDIVYALVPKTSLAQTLQERAKKVLEQVENRAEKTMALESQGGASIEDSAQQAMLMLTLDKRLWDDRKLN